MLMMNLLLDSNETGSYHHFYITFVHYHLQLCKLALSPTVSGPALVVGGCYLAQDNDAVASLSYEWSSTYQSVAVVRQRFCEKYNKPEAHHCTVEYGKVAFASISLELCRCVFAVHNIRQIPPVH